MKLGNANIKLALLVIAAVGGMIHFYLRTQGAFLDSFQRVIDSKPDYFMICEIAGASTSERCDIVERGVGQRFDAYIESLQLAKSRVPPGKVPISKENMLRIGHGSILSKRYIACFRLIEYVGFDNERYLNEIEADSECTRFKLYKTGYLSIPAQQ